MSRICSLQSPIECPISIRCTAPFRLHVGLLVSSSNLQYTFFSVIIIIAHYCSYVRFITSETGPLTYSRGRYCGRSLSSFILGGIVTCSLIPPPTTFITPLATTHPAPDSHCTNSRPPSSCTASAPPLSFLAIADNFLLSPDSWSMVPLTFSPTLFVPIHGNTQSNCRVCRAITANFQHRPSQ